MDLGGMHSYRDLVEFTSKYRKEHNLRGFDWMDFVGEEGLIEKDLLWAKYPTDDVILDKGTRGVFLSNYVGWNQTKHTKLMQELYDRALDGRYEY